MTTIPGLDLKGSKSARLEKWRKRLNFYAYAAGIVGEGDIYIPDEFGVALSAGQVVDAWKNTAQSIRSGQAPRELGIFVFVPFCRSKCVFCPYFSYGLPSGRALDVYTESLLAEMNLFKGVFKGVKFNTLWFGGGTPSILEAGHLSKVFKGLHDLFSFSNDVQVTFECSCSSMDYKKLKLLHELGVNRITLGVQSLNDRVLKINNRLFQDKNSSLKLIKDTRKIGIPVLNVDLMCGLPGDSLSSFIRGLREVISLSPDIIHINPFFPSAETNFYKLGRDYSREDAARRSREADEGTKILLGEGYRRIGGAFLGFSRVKGVENRQELDRISANSSYLSLGPTAHGHAFAQLGYVNAYFEPKWDELVRPRYLGCRFDLQEEMRKHLITNLRYVIYRNKFKKLFGKDILACFPGEIAELNEFGLVHIDQEKVYFKIKTRQEQLILAKHFFNHKYLRGLEKKSGIRFDKNKNYLREIAKLIDISV
ncbi:MAG: radical SAM protein [Candidatus Omnitrophota bacterium]|nr:radical SAM protein [Candidatus Omnitrophota bacterium]MDD5654053.1 radical SAM protein [Candidatus Omnitrophota bacterium]